MNMSSQPDNMDPIGLWMLKWVVIPFMLFMVIFMVIDVTAGKRKCSQMGKERGFLDSNYVPVYRYSGGYCIIKRKRNVDGTVDENAVMRIEMK